MNSLMALFLTASLLGLSTARADGQAFGYECEGRSRDATLIQAFFAGLEGPWSKPGIEVFSGSVAIVAKTSQGLISVEEKVDGQIAKLRKLRAYPMTFRMKERQFQQASITVAMNGESRISMFNPRSKQSLQAKLICKETR